MTLDTLSLHQYEEIQVLGTMQGGSGGWDNQKFRMLVGNKEREGQEKKRTQRGMETKGKGKGKRQMERSENWKEMQAQREAHREAAQGLAQGYTDRAKLRRKLEKQGLNELEIAEEFRLVDTLF